HVRRGAAADVPRDEGGTAAGRLAGARARATGCAGGTGNAGSHESGIAHLQRRGPLNLRKSPAAARPGQCRRVQALSQLTRPAKNVIFAGVPSLRGSLPLVPVLERRVHLVLGGDELEQRGPAFLRGRNTLLERVHHLIRL